MHVRNPTEGALTRQVVERARRTRAFDLPGVGASPVLKNMEATLSKGKCKFLIFFLIAMEKKQPIFLPNIVPKNVASHARC